MAHGRSPAFLLFASWRPDEITAVACQPCVRCFKGPIDDRPSDPAGADLGLRQDRARRVRPALGAHGVEILSTGGTAKALKDAGLAVKDVAEHTGFPEMMDGRLKTLHPKVHGGLLAIRGNAEHEARGARRTASRPSTSWWSTSIPSRRRSRRAPPFDDCIENIDIGGPAMIRAAAKNHAAVTVVVDPEDYARVLDAMAAHGGATTLDAAQGARRQGLRPHRRLRRGHRRLVRRHAGRDGAGLARLRAAASPRSCATARTRTSGRRSTLGRAPPGRRHRRAAPGQGAVLQQPRRRRRGHGADRRVRPRRVAGGRHHQARQPLRRRRSAATLGEAYAKALRCDPVSAFGGIIALNGTIDAATAREITAHPHRDRHRARRHAGGQGDLRRKEEPAPADHRRPARPARGRPHLPLARRRLSRAVARQRRGGRPRR